jgi:membrane protein DedA with SNARE-associated domain
MGESIFREAGWLLFVGILANQAGVPIPAAPWLLAAGMLVASGHLSPVVVVAGAVGGALAADLTWYGLGRWQGARALIGLLRLLRQPPATVDRVTRAFRAHQVGFLWSARFLPELNPVAAGLSGVTRVGLARFLLYAGGSALAWAAAWVGGGILLAGSIDANPEWLGIPITIWVGILATAVTIGVAVLAGWRRRQRLAVDPGASTEPRMRSEHVRRDQPSEQAAAA